MIDFGALVLAPAMTAFAGPITITPTISQPGAPVYPARGVFSSKAVEIQLEGSDDFHQTRELTLGIRLGEFATPPRQGDSVQRTAGVPATPGALPDGTFDITNIIVDGQGGAVLVIRETDRA